MNLVWQGKQGLNLWQLIHEFGGYPIGVARRLDGISFCQSTHRIL